jgi:endonuclease/exonuclease/phosphatase family metal-dependent hydrolase
MRLKKKRLFPKITHRALMGIAAGLLIVSYLSAVVDPAKAWFVTIFGQFFLILALINAGLLLWAIFRRSGSVWIPLFALLPTVFFFGLYYQFSGKDYVEPARRPADEIKIVSYNVGRFDLPRDKDEMIGKDACADSVYAFLRTCDADIICLQEFYLPDDSHIADFLKKTFPDYVPEYFMYVNDSGCYGNVTLSRFPVIDKGKFDFEHSANLAIFSDYDVNGRKFRVYNCHFESYNISLSRVASAMGHDRELMKETETKVQKSVTLRPKQVDVVMSDIKNCPLKAFVVGDFNDNPLSYTYYRLSRGRKDSFVEAGTGWGTTYSVLKPLLRIDYILFPPEYEALSHKVLPAYYSDHFPIMATIKIK